MLVIVNPQLDFSVLCSAIKALSAKNGHAQNGKLQGLLSIKYSISILDNPIQINYWLTQIYTIRSIFFYNSRMVIPNKSFGY